MDWKSSIHSDTNREFLSNPFPEIGEEVEVRLRHLPTDEIREVLISLLVDGHALRLPMEQFDSGGQFTWHRVSVTMTQPSIRYYFIIRLADGHSLIHTRNRLTGYHPDRDRDFLLETGGRVPGWVGRSVFYHIFPDRFAPDGMDTGVKTSEYKYDGGTTKALAWDETPLEFEEGRCLDFFNGTLKGIEEKIPYLKELGVTALYLNPIFTAKTVHRYDCTDYFHVDPHLGGDESLISLTEALHREGMKIIIDVSINHTGVDHPWLVKAQEDPKSEEANYYYRNEDGGFAFWFDTPTLPQLRYSSEKLWERIISGDDSLVRHYIKPPFNIDGWRFDVGNMTGRKGPDQLSHDIFRDIRRKVREINPEAYIIGEDWEDSIAYLDGAQWDSAMNYFASGRPLRRFAGELDRFIHWTEAASTAPPVTGIELKEQIEQHFSRIPSNLVHLQFNLLDSHDMHRLHHHAAVYNEALYRGITAFLFLLPGTPSVYYGDEIGIDGHDRTVEGCRYPMPWDTRRWDSDRLDFFKKMISLKTSEPALEDGSMLLPYADETGCLLVRFSGSTGFAVFLNRSPKKRTVELPLGSAAAVAAENLESGETIPVWNGWVKLVLPPFTCPVLGLTLDP